MKLERFDYENAMALAKTLPYAFITELSRIHFGSTPERLDDAEWVEAHFFDDKQELRFMPDEDSLTPILLTEELGDRFFDERPVFAEPPQNAQKILIRKYIQNDEDGQAYIAAVRFTVKEDVE